MNEHKPEAKMLKEMFGDDLESAKLALLEFYSQSVLLLAFSDKHGANGKSRTGLYATLEGKQFVITAGHELDNSHLDDFCYQSRPAKWRSPSEGPGRVQHPDIPTPTRHVDDRVVVGHPLDICIMRIEPLPDKGGKVIPYPLEQNASFCSPIGTKTIAIGYPGDLRDDKENDPLTFKPLGHWSHTTEGPQALNFEPLYHFATGYKQLEGDLMHGKSTRGMSGAPVFVVPPAETAIAIPGLLLCGIQNHEYLDCATLRATRIEHIIPYVKLLLARSR